MEDATREQWVPVPGYEDLYEVSDLGRVRSQRRHGSLGGILKTQLSTHGYPSLELYRDAQRKRVAVHILVAQAFLGPPPQGCEVRHKDGVRTNSVLRNLEYGTRSDNVQDMLRHGTHNLASMTHCKRGHQFTPENTWLSKRGSRNCRACRKVRGN